MFIEQMKNNFIKKIVTQYKIVTVHLGLKSLYNIYFFEPPLGALFLNLGSLTRQQDPRFGHSTVLDSMKHK